MYCRVLGTGSDLNHDFVGACSRGRSRSGWAAASCFQVRSVGAERGKRPTNLIETARNDEGTEGILGQQTTGLILRSCNTVGTHLEAPTLSDVDLGVAVLVM